MGSQEIGQQKTGMKKKWQLDAIFQQKKPDHAAPDNKRTGAEQKPQWAKLD